MRIKRSRSIKHDSIEQYLHDSSIRDSIREHPEEESKSGSDSALFGEQSVQASSLLSVGVRRNSFMLGLNKVKNKL